MAAVSFPECLPRLRHGGRHGGLAADSRPARETAGGVRVDPRLHGYVGSRRRHHPAEPRRRLALHADRRVVHLLQDGTEPSLIERSGSGVELRNLDYENPGSNHGCGVETLGMFFHYTLLQFTQLNK